MNGSPRRKLTVILLLIGVVAVLFYVVYAFLWKSSSQNLPSEAPPLPDLPINPPADGGTPPPPPTLPL